MENSTAKTLSIRRKVYTQDAFNDTYVDTVGDTTIRNKLSKACYCTGPKVGRIFLSYIPLFRVLQKYKLKEYIIGDFLSGLTVSFVHLPLAIGLSVLASLPPINGLYSTFYSVLGYMIFGTSPYVSVGTNAVLSLLTKSVVEREAETFIASFAGANATIPSDEEVTSVKVGAAMTCCILVGVILMAMGILKMGILISYMSVSFVGGFTTAVALHIASSQIPTVFGIKVKTFAGAGKLIRMYIDFFSKIEQTNIAEIIIALTSIVILLLVKICINERFKEKMKMPIPIDLLLCIAATAISHFANLGNDFDVNIVGPIPSGFSKPAVPHFQNVGNFASDAFIMAILSMAMSISLAKLLANKYGQAIDEDQELIGYGASNFISGFFYSFPTGSAPARTMIINSLGVRTTLNAIPTIVFFVLVILFIGQLFVSLPLSVLAAIIIVCMKDLLIQYRDLPSIWKVNKCDFIIWVVTNSVSIFTDLNYGIIVGVGISIFLMIARDQIATGHVMGLSDSEDMLVKNGIITKLKDTKGIIIFKIPTSIYFATAERIKMQIFKKVVDPKKELKLMLKNIDKMEIEVVNVIDVNDGGNSTRSNASHVNGIAKDIQHTSLKSLVLDCSVVTYIDMAGVSMLKQLVKEYNSIKVDIYISGFSNNVVATLQASGFFEILPKTHTFIDVFDAISVLENDAHETDMSTTISTRF